MLLEAIKEKLEEVDPKVCYGIADNDIEIWNYIVFGRTRLKTSTNRTGRGERFDVHIVRENFIPEGLDEQIIAKVCEIDGVRETGDDGEYTYTRKPNTNTVVEVLTLHFVRARK